MSIYADTLFLDSLQLRIQESVTDLYYIPKLGFRLVFHWSVGNDMKDKETPSFTYKLHKLRNRRFWRSFG